MKGKLIPSSIGENKVCVLVVVVGYVVMSSLCVWSTLSLSHTYE